jgi:hypothetical protein
MKRKYLWLSAIVLILGAGTWFGIFIYKQNTSTGWEYNNPPNGGFDSVPYDDNGEGPGLILIEGGEFTMGKDSAGNSTVIIDGKEFTMGKMDSVKVSK